jgi:uncharacterized protein (TIGR00369 family)
VSGPGPRSRLVTWEDPRPSADAARKEAGLDFLRSIVEGRRPRPPIAAALDFDLREVAEGRAVFGCHPTEAHYNPIGMVHGGLPATLLDSATGCAVHTTLPAGTGYATVSLQVELLRPLTSATGPVRCEGRVVHRGSRMAIAEGEVIGERDGKVYARGRSVCLIQEPG